MNVEVLKKVQPYLARPAKSKKLFTCLVAGLAKSQYHDVKCLLTASTLEISSIVHHSKIARSTSRGSRRGLFMMGVVETRTMNRTSLKFWDHIFGDETRQKLICIMVKTLTHREYVLVKGRPSFFSA